MCELSKCDNSNYICMLVSSELSLLFGNFLGIAMTEMLHYFTGNFTATVRSNFLYSRLIVGTDNMAT